MEPRAFEACLVGFINRSLCKPGCEIVVDVDTPLFDGGIVDSMQVLALIAFTERTLGLRIPDHRVRLRNFRTVRDISAAFCPEEAECT